MEGEGEDVQAIKELNKAFDPFCPACGVGLKMQHSAMAYYAEHFPTLVMRCLECGKIMQAGEVVWRESKEETCNKP